MAHFPKPFFRPVRQLWYVQLNGKQINLGADKDAAFTGYHRLMQDRAKDPVAPPAEQRLVVVILDEFLDWCEKHRAADTYRWYKDRLDSFSATIGTAITADQLRPPPRPEVGGQLPRHPCRWFAPQPDRSRETSDEVGRGTGLY